MPSRKFKWSRQRTVGMWLKWDWMQWDATKGVWRNTEYCVRFARMGGIGAYANVKGFYACCYGADRVPFNTLSKAKDYVEATYVLTRE